MAIEKLNRFWLPKGRSSVYKWGVDIETESQFTEASLDPYFDGTCRLVTMVAPTSTLLPLDLMKAGESASIVEMHGESAQVHRLQEMGLRAGATIRMLKPGAPCLVALDDKRLSLRLGGLLDILVAVPVG